MIGANEALNGLKAVESRGILRSQKPYFTKASKGSTHHSFPGFKAMGFSGEVE